MKLLEKYGEGWYNERSKFFEISRKTNGSWAAPRDMTPIVFSITTIIRKYRLFGSNGVSMRPECVGTARAQREEKERKRERERERFSICEPMFCPGSISKRFLTLYQPWTNAIDFAPFPPPVITSNLFNLLLRESSARSHARSYPRPLIFFLPFSFRHLLREARRYLISLEIR